MKYVAIGTWKMCFTAFKNNIDNLNSKDGNSIDFIRDTITYIEDNENFTSVGSGGLPNEEGFVECDSAFMNGDTMAIGSIAGVRDIKNPIKVSIQLSNERFNSFLVAKGAEKYALKNKFEFSNMLTTDSKNKHKTRLSDVKKGNLSPYDGHDTVCVISKKNDSINVGTSTSGLFMKKQGRVGDSPIPGSGFYAESEFGAVAATGLGEDLYKGCLSYALVDKLRQGIEIQKASDEIFFSFVEKLKKKYGKAGAMSIISLDKNGNIGVSTNVEFPFVIASETGDVNIYIANKDDKQNKTIYKKADQEFIDKFSKLNKL